jgi:integrase
LPKGKGIYRRGAVWWIRFAGLDGRIRFQSSKSSNYRVAEALLTTKRKEIQDGKDPDPIKIVNHSFSELAEKYLLWAARQKSYKSKQVIVKQLVGEFGNVPLRRFSTLLVEEYQSKILAKGNKPATANRHLATMKHMFTKAVEWDFVEDEILKRVRRVKLLQENNRRLRFLSREECAALVNASSPHLKAIIVTLLNTGCRKEEVLSLEWDKHIDLQHGFILLDVTKNGERREIPINDTLRGVLTNIPRRDSPYVFSNERGERYLNIRKGFLAACKRAGINDYHPHDCRHTFASHLVMAGVDITTVKNLLGHKTLAMTLRYSHLSKSHTRNALSVLDAAINGQEVLSG